MKILIHPWFYFPLIVGLLLNPIAQVLHWDAMTVWWLTGIMACLPIVAAVCPPVKTWGIRVDRSLIDAAVVAMGLIGAIIMLFTRMLPSAPGTPPLLLISLMTIAYAVVTALANQLQSDEGDVVPTVTPPPVPVPPVPPLGAETAAAIVSASKIQPQPPAP